MRRALSSTRWVRASASALQESSRWDHSATLRLTSASATEILTGKVRGVAMLTGTVMLVWGGIGTFGLLAANGRAAALPAVITGFAKLSANARGAVFAEVTTAVALSAAQEKGVAAALRQSLGKDPEITTRVDPAILGGIKVKVGSRLFDASLRSKLDSLKFALKRA